MTILIRSNFQAHPVSPWPILTCASLLALTTSGVLTTHGFVSSQDFFYMAFILLLSCMSFWFRDVISEATYLGNHTLAVERGLITGIALFIVSEALFFFAIIWALFHSALSSFFTLFLNRPPRPHAFVSLPLQSVFGAYYLIKLYNLTATFLKNFRFIWYNRKVILSCVWCNKYIILRSVWDNIWLILASIFIVIIFKPFVNFFVTIMGLPQCFILQGAGLVYAIIRLNTKCWTENYAFALKDFLVWILIGTAVAFFFYNFFFICAVLLINYASYLYIPFKEAYQNIISIDKNIILIDKYIIFKDDHSYAKVKIIGGSSSMEADKYIIFKADRHDPKALTSGGSNSSQNPGPLTRTGINSSSQNLGVGRVGPIQNPASANRAAEYAEALLRKARVSSSSTSVVPSNQGPSSAIAPGIPGRVAPGNYVFKDGKWEILGHVAPATYGFENGEWKIVRPTPSNDPDVPLPGHRLHDTYLNERGAISSWESKYPNHLPGKEQGWGYFGKNRQKEIRDLLVKTIESDPHWLDGFTIPPRKNEPMLAPQTSFWYDIRAKYDYDLTRLTSVEWPVRHREAALENPRLLWGSDYNHDMLVSIMTETGDIEDQKKTCIGIMERMAEVMSYEENRPSKNEEYWKFLHEFLAARHYYQVFLLDDNTQ